MKKVLLVMVMVLMGVKGWGQEQEAVRHSFSLGYGLKTINELDMATAVDVFSPINFVYGNEINNIKPVVQFFLGFGFRCHKKSSTELTIGYCSYKADLTYPYSAEGWKMNSLVMMFNWKYSYLQKEALQMYTVLGSGFIFKKIEYSDYSGRTKGEGNGMTLAWQVSPLCIRYGKVASLFAEIGYGYKGILNIGGSVGL
jgi:hypothetical protein